jgi:hypothetical protein
MNAKGCNLKQVFMLTKSMERNDSGKANSSSAGQEIRAFYGIRKFIIALQTARNLSISRATLIQSTPSKPISLKYILIFSFHLRQGLPSDPFPSGLPTQNVYALVLSPTRPTCPAHLISVHLITRTTLGEQYQS